MRIAVIGRFKEQAQIRFLIDMILKPAGFTVCSRWLTSSSEDHELDPQASAEWAMTNAEDLSRAEVVLYVSSPVQSIGRHIDFGIALALRKPIIILGEREPTAYHRHPLVIAVTPTASFLVPILRGVSLARAALEVKC